MLLEIPSASIVLAVHRNEARILLWLIILMRPVGLFRCFGIFSNSRVEEPNFSLISSSSKFALSFETDTGEHSATVVVAVVVVSICCCFKVFYSLYPLMLSAICFLLLIKIYIRNLSFAFVSRSPGLSRVCQP